VDRIHASFSMLDLDATGTIDRGEMIEGLGADKTLFAYEAFNVFDKNHDGGLDFIEFLVAATKVYDSVIMLVYCGLTSVFFKLKKTQSAHYYHQHQNNDKQQSAMLLQPGKLVSLCLPFGRSR
jgi:hypothetical protein